MTAELRCECNVKAAGAPWVFCPVIENAMRPDVGAVLAWGIAIVARMILATPMLPRWPVFRRWYGWTDTLSERQRQALANRELRRYYQAASYDGQAGRVTPYLWWIEGTVGLLIAIEAALPVTDLRFPHQTTRLGASPETGFFARGSEKVGVAAVKGCEP